MIDIVYFWVDGNDPIWREKRQQYAEPTELYSKERFTNHDELKYSLRSVEKFAPWIRKIFIVTDSQKPHWLDSSNSKIKIIDHTEIMPKSVLPCFNSNVLDMYMYKIPDLSEQFLFANDDTFFGKPVSPNDFFAPDGFPILRFIHPLKRLKWHGLEHFKLKKMSMYYRFINNSTKLVKMKYNKYCFQMPHHNIDAYLKSDIQKNVEINFKTEFEAMANNNFRKTNDIQRIIHAYVALVLKRGHLRYVGRKESFCMVNNLREKYDLILQNKPLLFCINDTDAATPDDIAAMKRFLEDFYPEKPEPHPVAGSSPPSISINNE